MGFLRHGRKNYGRKGGRPDRDTLPLGIMPPQPAIPCRVAPQQSPTPFHRKTKVLYASEDFGCCDADMLGIDDLLFFHGGGDERASCQMIRFTVDAPGALMDCCHGGVVVKRLL